MNEVTFLWANDGWCYVPELKQRRKYILSKDGNIEMLIQLWHYVIPKVENVEQVTQMVLERNPLVWKEQVGDSCEIYEEVHQTQTERTKTHAHLPRQQSLK
jgi:hypothetical protein